MRGRKSTRSFFGSCCGTNGVINPVNHSSGSDERSHPQEVDRTVDSDSTKERFVLDHLYPTIVQSTNGSSHAEIIPLENLNGSNTQSPQNVRHWISHHSQGGSGDLNFASTQLKLASFSSDGMGDLESPHYVKRTAHIFQSHIITTHNGNETSSKSSPSYINVARSVSGYSSLSYNAIHQSTSGSEGEVHDEGQGRERWTRSATTPFVNNFSPSLRKHISKPPPPLPKSAPPLASPALVGRAFSHRQSTQTHTESIILDRIQRLYGQNSEVEPKTGLWKRVEVESGWIGPERVIPIQVEGTTNECLASVESSDASVCPPCHDEVNNCLEMDGGVDEVDKIVREGEASFSTPIERVGVMEESSCGAQVSLAMSPIVKNVVSVEKDGEYFLGQVECQRTKIETLIAEAEGQVDKWTESSCEEEAGKVRAAIGKARLLVNKKFKQFEGLCHTNLDQRLNGLPADERPTKNEDLEGFWDMVLIQVEHIHAIFAELGPNQKPPSKSEDSVPIRKCPLNKFTCPTKNGGRNKAVKATQDTSAADENRRKLLAEKRKAMKALSLNQQNTNGSSEVHILNSSQRNGLAED